MALPKRRHSHSRTHKRRTHQKLIKPSLVTCTHCRKIKPTHMVCPHCGFYAGREVVRIEMKEKKKRQK